MKKIIKIKDLLEFNPEAEIKVVMPDHLYWNGDLDYGWNCGEGESDTHDKEDAKEVAIFLGNWSENVAQA